MLLTRKSTGRSSGFTLVELMVAAALAITIMWILAEAFKVGIDFARNAHSTGDMMTQLNNAGQIMSRDLQAQKFQTGGSMRNPNGSANLMPDMLNALFPTSSPPMTAATGYNPPNGYFMLYSPPPSGTYNASAYNVQDDAEGFTITTTNSLTSTGTSSTGAYMAFTAYLPQGLQQNEFTALAPAQPVPGVANSSPTPYFSRAAEIAYFIGGPNGLGVPIGQTAPVTVTTGLLAQQPLLASGPQPLYNLYRRQRLVAVGTNSTNRLTPPITVPTQTAPNQYYDPSAQDVISFTSYQAPPAQAGQPPVPTNTVNNLASFSSTPYQSVTGPIPASAFRCTPQNPPQPPSLLQPLSTQGRVGDDILLTNVLSFEIQATWVPAPGGQPGFPNFIQVPSTTTPGTFIPLRSPRAFTNSAGNPNTDYPFDHLPNANINPFLPAHMFDTWYTAGTGTPNAWNNFNALYNPQLKLPQNPNLIPMPIRITGLQITIRIYDPKTNQARQNTWRVAM